MRIVVKLLVFVLIVATVLVAMLFSVENGELVQVNFIAASFTLPISLWLIASLLIGFVLGLLASSGLFFRLIAERRKARRIETSKKKLATL